LHKGHHIAAVAGREVMPCASLRVERHVIAVAAPPEGPPTATS
jgi:hypothetical protein